MPIVTHPIRAAAVAAVAIALLGFGVLAATASTQQRGDVLAQLQRPAALPGAALGPGPAETLLREGAYTLRLTLNPNRAFAHNHLMVALARDGRALSGARVTVVFSMPAMNMWQAFTSSLRRSANGEYAAVEPALGMPGLWQMRIQVVAHDGASFVATVDDRMGN